MSNRVNPEKWDGDGRANARVHSATKITEEERRKRQAEIPADTRSITGRLFGDPLPGRSALEQELRQ